MDSRMEVLPDPLGPHIKVRPPGIFSSAASMHRTLVRARSPRLTGLRPGSACTSGDASTREVHRCFARPAPAANGRGSPLRRGRASGQHGRPRAARVRGDGNGARGEMFHVEPYRPASQGAPANRRLRDWRPNECNGHPSRGPAAAGAAGVYPGNCGPRGNVPRGTVMVGVTERTRDSTAGGPATELRTTDLRPAVRSCGHERPETSGRSAGQWQEGV